MCIIIKSDKIRWLKKVVYISKQFSKLKSDLQFMIYGIHIEGSLFYQHKSDIGKPSCLCRLFGVKQGGLTRVSFGTVKTTKGDWKMGVSSSSKFFGEGDLKEAAEKPQ